MAVIQRDSHSADWDLKDAQVCFSAEPACTCVLPCLLCCYPQDHNAFWPSMFRVRTPLADSARCALCVCRALHIVHVFVAMRVLLLSTTAIHVPGSDPLADPLHVVH